MTPTLRTLLHSYRWQLLGAVTLQAMAGVFSLVPWVLLSRWAEALVHDAASLSMSVPLQVLLCVTIWLGCQAAATYCTHQVDVQACSDLRYRLLAHLQRLPLEWFARNGPDAVGRLAGQDIRALHQVIAHAPIDICNLVVIPITAASVLAWMEPALLVWCLIPLLMATAGYRLLRSRLFQATVHARNQSLEQLAQDYSEYARNLVLARQYPGAGVQGRACASAATFVLAFHGWVHKAGRVAALVQVLLSSPWMMGWLLAGACLFSWQHMPLDVGTLCAFILMLQVMSAPVRAMGHGGDALATAGEAADRLQAVFDLSPLSEGQSELVPLDGSIRLDAVSFAYAESQTLHDLNLTIAPASLVALVGPSGSGKSTLLHLLARFMDATSGSIRMGDVELRDLPNSVRREHIALVPQNGDALELSMTKNLALLNPSVGQEEIHAAAQAVCLDEWIDSLPRGYDSVVGIDAQLSGGELQRLSVARCLLSRAPVLLLDEPTSACDPATAAAVQRALRSCAATRTRLIVAHRLAEVCDADLIVVVEHGRIIEQGQHGALLAASGVYARMWREQGGDGT